MVIDNYVNLCGKLGISGLFFASGSFGIVDGDITYTRTDSENKTVFEPLHRHAAQRVVVVLVA